MPVRALLADEGEEGQRGTKKQEVENEEAGNAYRRVTGIEAAKHPLSRVLT